MDKTSSNRTYYHTVVYDNQELVIFYSDNKIYRNIENAKKRAVELSKKYVLCPVFTVGVQIGDI